MSSKIRSGSEFQISVGPLAQETIQSKGMALASPIDRIVLQGHAMLRDGTLDGDRAERAVCASYVPPACSALFADVPCSSPFAEWIEQLYAESVTGGCSTYPLLYCPAAPNTRGQMAVFVTKTFSLQ
ncbi:MAG TPA: hypothetical protein VGL03_04340 [Thermoanaerobaculia bacterium]|jgi:hypothetical protein